MNRIEDRLRDAFAAAAETVRPESVAGLADHARVARARRLAPLVAAAAVALIVIGLAVAVPLALAGGHGAPPRPAGPAAPSSAPASPSSAAVTTVPDVVGMTADQAVEVLSNAGLEVTIVSQAAGAVPTGTVIEQNPVASTRLVSGAQITVTVAAAVPGSSPTPAPGSAG